MRERERKRKRREREGGEERYWRRISCRVLSMLLDIDSRRQKNRANNKGCLVYNHREEFGRLLICNGNPGLKTQERLGDSAG